VTVAVQAGTDLSAVKPFFSTEGAGVLINGALIQSGVQPINFGAPVTLKVWASNGSNFADYTIKISYYHTLAFTDKNYDFSGNIGSVISAINAGGSAAGTTIEGIITAKDVYLSKSFQNSFYIQDKDGGIAVLTNTTIGDAFPLGARVKLTITESSLFNSMPEIKNYSGLARVGSDIHDIYYKINAYNDLSSVGSVYRWDGTIQGDMDGYSVGTFEGLLCFHGTSALKSTLSSGSHGSFYGPISYSYSQFRMEINNAIQIVQ